jgi:hypothetical protein
MAAMKKTISLQALMDWLCKPVMIITLLLVVVAPPHSAAQSSRQEIPPSSVPSSQTMLQFSAGGHMLGFMPGRVVLASVDHALTVDLLGSRAPAPQAPSAPQSASTLAALHTVTYPQVWPGIDVTYQNASAGIAESTYTLAPGVEAGPIQLRYNAPVTLQPDGSLTFELPSNQGAMSETAPVAWQTVLGHQKPVSVRFTQIDAQTVGFALGETDPRYPVTIDPVYQWHTFAGGSGFVTPHAVATDTAGNIYITGETPYDLTENSFGDGAKPLHFISNTANNIFVLKLDPNGQYLWHTFYGSGIQSSAAGIAVDGSNNVYVTGWSNGSWIGAGGVTPKHAYSGSSDIFVLKLDTNGAYQWHTFYGSSLSSVSGADVGNAIALDQNGNVFVIGYSLSNWSAGDDNLPPKHSHQGDGFDVVLLKLSTDGSYQWHTFFGAADSDDAGNALAVSGNGDVYVTGYSSVSWGSPSHGFSGMEDVLVFMVNNAGNLVWNTFYGGSGNETGEAIAVDTTGSVYISGTSYETWLGPASNAPKHAFTGLANPDIFALKLNNLGNYAWHTFYGSDDKDFGAGIAVSPAGSVYISGTSNKTWDAGLLYHPLRAFTDGLDAVVIKLGSDGTYGSPGWHSFYGSRGEDAGAAIAVTQDGSHAILLGGSSSSWGVLVGQPPVHAHSKGNDLFALSLTTTGAYSWHTFYGGMQDDRGFALAVDANENVYIVGNSTGTWGTPIHPYSETGDGRNEDIVVVKLNSSGAHVWHTFYGAAGRTDYGEGIRVDQNGNVFVLGLSYGTWEGDANANPLHAFKGSPDITLIKLNADGVYQWHTFIGDKSDYGYAMAMDQDGNIYIAGASYSQWAWAGTTDPIHPYSAGGTNNIDVLVVKVNKDGAYQWHTYYGASGNSSTDMAYQITVDRDANVYVVGASNKSWLGDGDANPKYPFGCVQTCGFLLKLDTHGIYQWHTFYGAGSTVSGQGVAVDPAGNVYAAGTSAGVNWLVDGQTNPLQVYHGADDIFLVKFDPQGKYLLHSFYGTDSWDEFGGIATDARGSIFITGSSGQTWGSPLHAYQAMQDILVMKINADEAVQWLTFYGSDKSENAYDIQVSQNGSIYLTGYSVSSWLGDGNHSPVTAATNGASIFALKLKDPTTPIYLPFARR